MTPTHSAIRSCEAHDDQAIPIVVIDYHDVVRAGIRHWISTHPPIEVMGSYSSPQQYLNSRDGHDRSDRAVIVFDPERGDDPPNLSALARLSSTGSPVVVYSRTTSPEITLRCVDGGAMSYVAKSEPGERLLDAISEAWQGLPSTSPTLLAAERLAARNGRPRLTAQEQRVMVAWLQANSKRDAATQLHIAVTTVRTHVQRIRRRYDEIGRPASDKAMLFARAIQDGFVGPWELG